MTIDDQVNRIEDKIENNTNLRILSIPQIPSKEMLNRNLNKENPLSNQ